MRTAFRTATADPTRKRSTSREDRVIAHRLHERDTSHAEQVAEVAHLADPGPDMFFLDGLRDADRHRGHVPAAQAAVSVQALRKRAYLAAIARP